MPSDSQDTKATPKRSRLPFEPAGSHKRPLQPPVPSAEQIPAVVSQRMVRRMVLLCGVPTLLGLLTFPLSYLVVSQGWLNLPVITVLLTTLGLFGLGVIGLSYGIFSASWDEDRLGSQLGWSEFKLNFGRMTEAWQAKRTHDKS